MSHSKQRKPIQQKGKTYLDVALAQVINFTCGASIVVQAMELGIYVMHSLADGSGIGGGFSAVLHSV